MKKLLSILLVCTTVFSCDSDEPSPPAPSNITIDGVSTSFETVVITDVGMGLDINMKSSTVELAIQLEEATGPSHELADVTLPGAKRGNGIAILTSSSERPLYSKSGTVTIDINDGKYSGTIDIEATDVMQKKVVKIKGTYNNISGGDLSGLGCLLDKTASPAITHYRYSHNGNLTERRRMTKSNELSERRLLAWFNNEIIELNDFVGLARFYPVEYSGNKISKIGVMTLAGPETGTRLFEYNPGGRIVKLTVQDENGTNGSSRCFYYDSENNIIKDERCEPDNSFSINTYDEFDDKKDPFTLLAKSADSQDAILHRFRTFGGDFSSHNLLKYTSGGYATYFTYPEYNQHGYPVAAEWTYEGDSDTGAETYTYRNCN